MSSEQLGFADMLHNAARDNAARAFDKETTHLPGTWAEALDYHNQQIANHHAAMLNSDLDLAIDIRKEAHLLAKKLNNGNPGILAGNDAPGCKLDRQAAAQDGLIPMWGQSGTFAIEAAGMQVRVTMGGMFGIGATAMPYLGFAARAVDRTKPFLSATGYRSFLGCTVPPVPGLMVDGLVRRILRAHVTHDLGGRLVPIDPEWPK
ncbi:hypothetical protein [Cognatiyoonia sp. IB215182]|uniref:hypothetical protein n=1 Tax=Cognatiyoonia sp. IB215182 TaxID=3097353 RepID=UPI002A176492|nr:hypothetical protein [Cognatiyoonia sp. IB215182]MDX8353992.1 hypothetical protein [Cognatiyoonia sp. IB215182]